MALARAACGLASGYRTGLIVTMLCSHPDERDKSVIRRARNMVQFRLERALVRGALSRLLVIDRKSVV